MTKGPTYWLGVVIAVAIVVATPLIAYQLVKLFYIADTNVKLGALTAIISLVALLYNNARQQAREIASRHFSEKRQAYQKFFDLLFEFMYASRLGTDDKDVPLERLGEILKNIMVWGSADTIKSYNEFMVYSANPTEKKDPDSLDVDVFIRMEDLLRNMRKDLGHSDGRLDRFALSKLFLKGDEHHKFS